MFIAREKKISVSGKVGLGITIVVLLTVGFLMSGALAEEQVVIRWWGESDPGSYEANIEVKELFEKAYPNIKVEYDEFPEFQSKLASAFAAGNPPDVSPFYARGIGKYIQADALRRLTPEIMSKEELRKKLYCSPENKEPLTGSDGEFYAIPVALLSSQTGYMINENLWEKAGLAEYPKTWEEFMAAARKLTERDETGKIVQAGMGRTKWDWYVTMLLTIKQSGGDYYNPETKRWNLNSPEAIQAIEFWKENYLQVNGPEITSNYASFLKGQLGMLIVQPWAWSEMTAASPDLEGNMSYHLLPLPPNTKVPYRMLLEYQKSWGTPKTSKQPEAVEKFIEFWTRPKVQMMRERGYPQQFVIAKAAWEWDEFKKGGVLYYQAPVIDLMKNHPDEIWWDYAGLPGRNEINDIIKEAWDKIMNEELSVGEAAAEMQYRVDGVMKRYSP